MTLFLVPPAFNEERELPHLLEAVRSVVAAQQYALRLVIADDGSTDATRRVATESRGTLPLELVVHPLNRGLGETIRDGLMCACRVAAPGDVIITMDADNTQPPELIPEMLRQLDEGSEMVIASRYRRGSRVIGLAPRRRLMTYGARCVFQILFPTRGVRDYTSGFRAYRASLLQHAFKRFGPGLVSEHGFACMAEILLHLRSLGAPMSEVPMVLRYDQKKGASKMRVARTVFTTLRMLLRLRFTRGQPASV